MSDADLFIHLAEIAGVFVGFGALIALRSSEAADVRTVEYLRGMVAGAMWVIIAALAPIALSRFGVEGRPLWLACSALALVLFLVFWIADARSPENRAERTRHRTATRRFAAVAIPMTVLVFAAFIIILIGAWPEVHQALYFAAVALVLLEQGWTLIALVWTRGRSRRGTP